MHELSIADSMVRIADRHAAGRRVARVEVMVGALRQVVPSALEFAFGLVAEGTAVEGAEVAIEEVPAAGVCRGCAAESVLSGFPWRCPRCGGLELEVVRGEELQVESLELEDQLATSGGMAHGD
jgi:hydrogenase nickel incorporation protein HypA/HybF